jgi:excisionase family DNA binding protein
MVGAGGRPPVTPPTPDHHWASGSATGSLAERTHERKDATSTGVRHPAGPFLSVPARPGHDPNAALEPSAGDRAFRALIGMERPSLFNNTIAVSVELAEPLLTATQVAELLAVPRSSVYEYARRPTNPLPSIGIGRHRRFYRSDIESWLAELRTAAT